MKIEFLRPLLLALSVCALSNTMSYGQDAAPSAILSASKGTQIEVELTETVSTRTHGIGARFGLRLAAPLVVGGQELIPVGVTGEGVVIDSGKGGMGGKPGKLVLAARFLTVNGTQVAIRGLSMSRAGTDRSNASMGVAMIPYVGLASILVSGGDVVITSGGRASARLAQDFPVSPSADATTENNVTPDQRNNQ